MRFSRKCHACYCSNIFPFVGNIQHELGINDISSRIRLTKLLGGVPVVRKRTKYEKKIDKGYSIVCKDELSLPNKQILKVFR